MYLLWRRSRSLNTSSPLKFPFTSSKALSASDYIRTRAATVLPFPVPTQLREMSTLKIPKTQTAAVLYSEYGQKHSIEHNYPVPQHGVGEVLIRVEASSVCSGDVNPRDGFPPAPKEPRRPIVLGHEGVGEIVAVGRDVRAFSVGDRVGMGWRSSVCTTCELCKAGKDNWCQSVMSNGYDNNGTFQGQTGFSDCPTKYDAMD